MICSHCGEVSAADARFCPSCGRSLSAPASSLGAAGETANAAPAHEAVRAVVGEPAGETSAAVTTATDVDVPAAAERVACPACGAPNSPHRILCGRCAADLATGELAASPSPTTPPPVSEQTVDIDEQHDRGRRARHLTRAVVAAIVLALAAAVLAALGVLPSGDGDPPPVASFDDAAYPGPLEDLRIEQVTTTSTLPAASDALSYEAARMLDGELATAWNNDGDVNADGVGEVVQVEFASPVWLSRLVVGNGAQLDDARFLGNARIERADVTLDGGVGFVLTLDDSQGLQQRSLPEPQLTTSVRIEVAETYPGDTHGDLAVSELGFRGYPANDTDRRIAERRAEDEQP